MREIKVWEPLSVKLQTYRTAIECAAMLLRIDDIVSGIKRKERETKAPEGEEEAPEQETVIIFYLFL